MSDSSYQCDQCPLSFRSTECYDKHKLVHALQRQYVCLLCMSVFPIAKGLEGHLKKHQEFKQEEDESTNLNNNDWTEEEFQTASPHSYNDEKESCDVIDTNLRNGQDNLFQCKSCPSIFPTVGKLLRHTLVHQKGRKFTCKICGYVCAVKITLIAHLKQQHSGEADPACKICGLSFNTYKSLRIHITTHCSDNVQGNPSLCHICKLEFTTTRAIKEHLFADHPESIFKCGLCKAIFATKQSEIFHMFQEHKVNTHAKIRFWCNTCGNGYGHKSKLNAHRRKKHGETIERIRHINFWCDICGSGYKHKSKLYAHRRQKHGEKNNERTKTFEPVNHPFFGRMARPKSSLQENCLQDSADLGCLSAGKRKETNVVQVVKLSDLKKDVIRFEGQIIYPCYVPIPFVKGGEVTKINTSNNMDVEENSKENQILSSKEISGNLNPTNQLDNLSKRKSFLKALTQLEEVENHEDLKDSNFPSLACATNKMSQPAQSPSIKNLPVEDSHNSIKVTILEDQDDYQIQNQMVVYPVSCPKCSTKIKGLEALQNHMKDHWTVDNLCPICYLKIGAICVGNFKQHLNSHMQKRYIVCKICKLSCANRGKLFKHLKTHGKRL